MGVNVFGKLTLAGVVSLFGISAVQAAVPATEVVNLPSDAAYGGGDRIGSQLIAATYNAGEGPGIWIVADGGYRLQVEAKDLEGGTHSAVAVVTDNSGLTWMSPFVTFTEEGTLSSSSVSESLSSEAAESSSSIEAVSSSGTTAIVSRANFATEAEAGFYRIFDLQGRPLFAGFQKPAKIPATRVMVVEYTTAGKVKRRYLE